jgi:hypothetical protein
MSRAEAEDVARIAAGLTDFEKEWLTGWQGPDGAAFNVVATGLLRKGLLVGSLNWNLNELGLAVRAHLEAKVKEGGGPRQKEED